MHATHVFAPGRIQENIPGELFMYNWFCARGYDLKRAGLLYLRLGLFTYGWSLLLMTNRVGLVYLRLRLFFAYNGKSVWSLLLAVRPIWKMEEGVGGLQMAFNHDEGRASANFGLGKRGLLEEGSFGKGVFSEKSIFLRFLRI